MRGESTSRGRRARARRGQSVPGSGGGEAAVVDDELVGLNPKGARQVNRVERRDRSRRKSGGDTEETIVDVDQHAGLEQALRLGCHLGRRIRQASGPRYLDERDPARGQQRLVRQVAL